MENNGMERIMLKFIFRCYPVSRYKINNRFKRGILLDDGNIYQLNNKKEINNLYYKLTIILKHVFKCDEVTCKIILNQVL